MRQRDVVTPVLMVAGMAAYVTIALFIHGARWANYQATQKTR